MTAYHELLRQRADEAEVMIATVYANARNRQAELKAANDAARRAARPGQESLEDSAAAMIAAQYGISPDDVVVNGRRYGDIVAARQS